MEQLENQVVETVEEAVAAEPVAEFTEETVEVENQVVTEDASNSTEFAQKEEEEEKPADEEGGESESDGESEEDENKKPVKNSLHTDEEYDALQAQFTALQEQYEAAQVQLNELVEFKNNIEDKQKDALIAQFFMLSEEDKQDVIENKRQYSLEDIESKLAVICYRKKINFNLDASSETSEEEVVTTFSLNDVGDSTPDWVKSVMDHQKKN